MLRNLNETYGAGIIKKFIFYSDTQEDLLFKKGENIRIFVVGTCRYIRANYGVSYNRLQAPFYKGKAISDSKYTHIIEIDSNMLSPGFYDIHISADKGFGAKETDRVTFGYDIENMSHRCERPEDFAEFWEKSKKRLEGIDLDAKIESAVTIYDKGQIDSYNYTHASLPYDYDPNGHKYERVESYKISFQSVGRKRIYAWFAKPVTDEKLPIMMVYPGAGFFPRPRPLEHARHGYAALDIQVHGQDVENDDYKMTSDYEKYEDTSWKMEHIYNDIYLHCIQAINYMCSRDDVDTSKIATVGGSQGGRLSITTAALDKRVTATVAGIIHYANMPYYHWSDKLNAEEKNGVDNPFETFTSKEAPYDAYYDVVSFAQDITCPAMINGGLIDLVSPPGGILNLFTRIKSENKCLELIPNFGHDWFCDFDKRAWRWLEEVL